MSRSVLAVAPSSGVVAGQLGYPLRRRADLPLGPPNPPRLTATVGAAHRLLHRYSASNPRMLARFVPLVRAVVNPPRDVLAGPAAPLTVGKPPGRPRWSLGASRAADGVGRRISDVDRHLLPVTTAIVSLIPVALELRRARGAAAATS